MKIGERITRRREELGYSVDDLAAKIGKNRSTVYRYENDEIENFPVSALSSIAEALEVSPAWLMGIEEATLHTTPPFKKFLTMFGESPITDDEQTLLSSYRSLNEDGRTFIRAAVASASSNPAYQKDTPNTAT